MRKINAEDRCVCSWDPRNSRRNATCHTHLVKAAREKKRRGGTDEPSAPRQPHHSPSAQPQLLRSPARITQHTHSQTRRHTHTRTRTQTHTHTHRHRQREKERERDKHTHSHILPANGPNDLRPTGHWPRDAANRCGYLRVD